MATLAFLGTGLIGAALAEGAKSRGDDVTVWNRSPAKAAALAPRGIALAPSVAAAVANAERVHLALTDDGAVDAVLAAAGTALRGKLVVDHSTTSPAGTARRAAALAAAGVRFLHAPVFMSPKLCREAGGLMIVAGPRELFDEARGGLAAMTARLEHVGERADLAAAYKLFGNALIVTITAGLADVFAMAGNLGIEPRDAHRLFSWFNAGATVGYRGGAMAKGDYTASFELAMARKDVRLMVEAAEGSGVPLAVLPAVAARMDALLARGLGARDLGALAVDAVPEGSG